MQKKIQTYKDGVVNIYSVTSTAQPGNKPTKKLDTLKVGRLRYDERIVGISRFYTARQAGVKIDKVIRVPRFETVSSQDVAVLHDGRQYDIKLVQYPPDVEPPSMDLSLEKVVQNYDLI